MLQSKPTEFASVEEILTFAMEEEQQAAHYYEDAATRVVNPDMKHFLLILAKMELEHYNILKKKLEECRANHFCTNGILASFDEE